MAAITRQHFAEALSQLATATDPGQVQRLLHTSPWLLSDEADAELSERIEANKENALRVALFTALRGLLRRCRSAGVQTALAMQPEWPLASNIPAHKLREGKTNHYWRHWAYLAVLDQEEAYGLGLVYHAQASAGKVEAFPSAITCLETAVDNLTPPTSAIQWTLRGHAQHNLAHLFLERPQADRRSNIEQALHWLEQAQSSFDKSSDDYVKVLMLQGVAYLRRIQGERLHNIEQGIQSFQKAYEIAQTQSDQISLSEIEHNLADAYRIRLQGRPAENQEVALNWAQKALDRLDQQQESRPEDRARTLQALAIIYRHRVQGDQKNNLEKAIAYNQEALNTYQPDTHPQQWASATLSLGNLYCDRIAGDPRTNYEQARECFQDVLKTRNKDTQPIEWADIANNLGTVYAGLSQRPFDANYRQAMDYFQQALARHGPDKLPDRARRTAVNQGNLAFRYQQWSDALQSFQIALGAGEALFQASGTQAGRQAELAENAGLAANAAFCRLQLDPPQPAAAFWQLEQGKTRLLAEALALKDADLEALPHSQKQAVKKLRQDIHQLEAEMRLPPQTPSRRDDIELGNELLQTRQALRERITEIRRTRPDFLKIATVKTDLPDLIPKNGAVVAPLITAQGSVAFVIPHGSQTVEAEHVVPLPLFSEDDLKRLLIGTPDKPGWMTAYLDRSRSAISWIKSVTHFTQELWSPFIQPIAVKLNQYKCKKVIIMPQGGLQLLPLHAAWYQENNHRHYFIDDFETSYVPSLSVMSLAQKRVAGREGKAALIAGINDYKVLKKLKHAVTEAEWVAENFNTTPYLDEQATCQTILDNAPDKNYLHLACHGLFNWENPLDSALYLADEANAPLSLNIILAQLDLAATRLVTLSACETGISDVTRLPDEFVGLPAGLMQAGAPGVVSSLWSVDDNSTSILMERFYAYHLENHVSPAAALRKAQERLRQFDPLYEKPFFWAAFTFYGV